MPISVVVQFKPITRITNNKSLGKNAHALFFKWINSVNHELANELHKDHKSKPFTISMIMSEEKKESYNYFEPGERLWMRITFLDDIITLNFLDFISVKNNEKYRLGDGEIVIDDVKYFDNPWTESKDYQTLWENAECSDAITLIFKSPTTFKSGDIYLPLPLPINIFKSLLKKWNEFSPYFVDETILQEIECSVGINKCTIKTQKIYFGEYNIIGFIGMVDFNIASDVSRETKRVINLLADFAVFSGIGYKTTMGMGMCMKLKGAHIKTRSYCCDFKEKASTTVI